MLIVLRLIVACVARQIMTLVVVCFEASQTVSVESHCKNLVGNLQDIFPAPVQERRLAIYNVRAGIEVYLGVKSHAHVAGTVDQDHDKNPATASISISHDSSITSASDSHGGAGEVGHSAYQGIDKDVCFSEVRRSDQV